MRFFKKVNRQAKNSQLSRLFDNFIGKVSFVKEMGEQPSDNLLWFHLGEKESHKRCPLISTTGVIYSGFLTFIEPQNRAN